MEHSEEKTATPATDNSQSVAPSGEDANARYERLKQQLHWREKQATEAEERAQKYKQTALNREYKRVWKWDTFDKEAFQELYSEDPELADSLADKFTIDNRPAKNAKEILERIQGNESNKWAIEKDVLVKEISAQIREELMQEGIIRSARSAFSHLPDEKQQEAQTYFDRMTGGRKLSESEAQEFADMASTYVMRWEVNAKKSASMASMSFGGNVGTNPAPQGKRNDFYEDGDIKDYMLRYSNNPKDQHIIKSIFQ